MTNNNYWFTKNSLSSLYRWTQPLSLNVNQTLGQEAERCICERAIRTRLDGYDLPVKYANIHATLISSALSSVLRVHAMLYPTTDFNFTREPYRTSTKIVEQNVSTYHITFVCNALRVHPFVFSFSFSSRQLSAVYVA